MIPAFLFVYGHTYPRKGQILRSTPNTAPLICGACNTQPEGLLTTGYYYPRFTWGCRRGRKRELGEGSLLAGSCFDGRYYAVSGRCTVDRKNFICYDVVTGTRLSLGDRVTYEGRELTVSRKKTELVRGEVIFTYRLAGSSYTWVPWEDNPDYTGMSFVGSIVGTQGEQVEVAFDIDKTAAGGNRYGFAPATGNLMYCMPQKGTKTSLYIGNGDEAQGIATGCIRTNGAPVKGREVQRRKVSGQSMGKEWTCIRRAWD